MTARQITRVVGPPILTLLALTVFAEFVVRMDWVKSFIIPAPSSVFASVLNDHEEFLLAFFDTSTSAFLGLVLSFTIGTSIAILLSSSHFLRRAFYPYAIFFQTVPVIAIAPLLVIWFGFGKPTVIASAFIVSIFPIVASTLLGLQSTEPALVDLFKLYSASPRDSLLKLRIPFAMPMIFSGLRIAAGLAVIGAIVGEFIGGGGLGSVVDAARTQQRLDKVFAAVLISSLLGLILVGIVDWLSWLALRRWRV
jgi:NitT/TauT family transport system permease protein